MPDEKNPKDQTQGSSTSKPQPPPQQEKPNPDVKPPDFARIEKDENNNIKK